MTAPVRVVVCGATGRTGNAVVCGLVARHAREVTVVAGVAPSASTTPRRGLPDGVPLVAALADVDVEWDVLVDLSVADAVPGHLEQCLLHGRPAVVGTTGIDDAVLADMGARFEAAGCGLLFAPNFAIGAVLMMQWAAEMARAFPDVEIVETHHARKLDAPSGTAIRTARMIAAARQGSAASPAADASRGEIVDGVPVHSLRLAGAVAHQEVVGSGVGELLTIRHDAVDRSCYAAGVARAVVGVAGLRGLVIGLEHVL